MKTKLDLLDLEAHHLSSALDPFAAGVVGAGEGALAAGADAVDCGGQGGEGRGSRNLCLFKKRLKNNRTYLLLQFHLAYLSTSRGRHRPPVSREQPPLQADLPLEVD